MIDKLKNRFVTGTFVADVKQYFTKINEIIDYLNNQVPAVNYKIYRALLTQTGGSDPVVTVLENTLGETITWLRDNAGIYSANSSGIFLQNKTFLTINKSNYSGRQFSFYRTDNDKLEVVTEYFDSSTPTFVQDDDILINTSVEIIIYN
jgi:hypothetical protein